MKKVALFVGTLFFTMFAAAQQQENEWGLSLFGGLGIPSASFADAYGTGFTFGGELTYNVASQTTIGIRAGYHRFAVTDEGARNLIYTPHGGTYTSFSFEGGEQNQFVATANVSQQLSPPDSRTGFSVLLGAGLYVLSTSDITARYSYTSPVGTGSGTATTSFKGSSPYFGLNGGVGLTQWVSNAFGVIAEGRYNMIFSENESTSVLTVLAGVRFQFGGGE